MRKQDYYSKDEIKRMFQFYREKGDMNITDREYDILCDAIRCLPKEIVNKIKEEVYFVVLSLGEGRKQYPACYLSTYSECLKSKKGIIFLTPLIFESKPDCLYPTSEILHEVAHHVLGHMEENAKTQREAKKLAEKWILLCLG
jgi:hypothetical protein